MINRYRESKALFLDLIELHPETRNRRLEALERRDPELARSTRRLLRFAADQDPLSPVVDRALDHLTGSRRLPQIGEVIADRYRVLDHLGEGGMGEVLLVHDRWLDQNAALKLWTTVSWLDGSERVERLRTEAKLARRVEHPNVCRVFDVGLWQSPQGDEPFLTLEYVPGTDLAQRLSEHGPLPLDRLRSLALQLCSALAAIHKLGILHRDLKPANVLLSESGRIRLTDFGIAVDRGMDSTKSRALGTPGYLAPELSSGGRPSEASDLYALGVLLREASGADKTSDPILRRVVERCLAIDPVHRPSSAALLVSVLEDDDPLEAVLALGDPPSPEIIAGSEASAVPGRRQAELFWLGCLSALCLWIWTFPHVTSFKTAGLSTPPRCLAERARALADAVAPDRLTVSRAWGFSEIKGERIPDIPYPLGLAQNGRDIYFWYRESSRSLVNYNALELVANAGRVHMLEPPPSQLGTLTLGFDPEGRLFLFQHQPLEDLDPSRITEGQSAEPDWRPLLQAAELDLDDFEPAPTSAVLPSVAEARSGFRHREDPIQLETGRLRNRAVLFTALETSSDVNRYAFFRQTVGAQYQLIVTPFFVVCVLFFARFHWRKGLGDPWGASRLATFVFITGYLSFLLQTNHSRDPVDEALFLAVGLSGPLLKALVAWTLYMGCEPWLRQHWPRSLVSWNRWLRDPRRALYDPAVAGHLLLGIGLGIFFVFCDTAQKGLSTVWQGRALPAAAHLPAGLPELRHGLATLLSAPFEGIWLGLLFAVVLAWSRRLFRRRFSELIAVAALAIGTVAAAPAPFLAVVFHGIGQVAVGCWATARGALLIGVTAWTVAHLLTELPVLPAGVAGWTWPLGVGVVISAMTLCLRPFLRQP